MDLFLCFCLVFSVRRVSPHEFCESVFFFVWSLADTVFSFDGLVFVVVVE